MRLKWVVIGVVLTLVALAGAAYAYMEMGFVDIRADSKPGLLDSLLAHAMDASTERHAPNITNPVPSGRESLLAAAKAYRVRCIICHGGPDGISGELGKLTSPPAPQFFGDDRPDMKENENFYIIRNGVRMTAMPAWGKRLSDQEIWKLVELLKQINDKALPPDAQQEIKQQPQS